MGRGLDFSTSTFVRRQLLSVFIGLSLIVQLGCGGTKAAARREKPVANATYSQISATGPIAADGVATVTVDVLILDQNAAPMAGVVPVLASSGSGNIISECSATDAAGASTCTMASTKAETKSLNLSAPVELTPVPVVFEPGPATKLAFSVQASDATAGEHFVVQPEVQVQDAVGNLVPTGSYAVTLSLQSGDGNLSGTLSQNTVAGIATYTGLSASAEGIKILKATATGLTPATSPVFEIFAASGNKLSFSVQPGGGAAGTAWAQQPIVRILDSNNTLVGSATDAVTLTLTSGSGTLMGTRTVNAVAGVATFTGLKMGAVGAKVVTATSPGISNIISNEFTIIPGAPSSLVYATQPGGGVADQVWSVQPVLRLFDSYGNLCSNSSATVAVSLQTGTGTLGGTVSLSAISGVATFTNLKMTVAGTKSIRATSGTVNTDSSQFQITAGDASQLTYVMQPGGGVAGAVWADQPVLEVRDDFDNRVVNYAGTVAVSLTAGTGTLLGTLAKTASSGIVIFTGLKMNQAGTDKELTATASGIDPLVSDPFTITHGSAHDMIITAAPSEDMANTILSTQPALEIRDSFGNRVTTGTDASAPIFASLNSGSGAIVGLGTIGAVNGVATFVGLGLSEPGAKVLRFTKPNLSSFGGTGSFYVNSASFNALIGPAAKVKFTTQSSGGVAGVVWGTQPVVEIQDVAGNRVVTSSGTVALALQSGSGSLLGTATAVASSGRATFSGLKINESGAKVLRASSLLLLSGDSETFDVTHAAASQITLSTQPGGGVHDAVWAAQPVVEVKDSFGNRVTTGVDATTFITANLQAGSGALSGTATVSAVSGVATFAGLNINLVGSKTLRFTKDDTSGSAGTTAKTVDSSSFDITAGAAATLAKVTEPAGATAGQAFSTQPVIEILDASGNRVTTSTAAVTVSMFSGTGTLLGTATVNAVAGVATFAGLQINTSGSKVLRFASTGLTSVDSVALSVVPALASSVVMTTEPSGAVVNTAFSAQPIMEIRDLYGNRVNVGTDATANVTASVFSGTGNLTGTLTVAAIAGVATFTNLKFDAIGAKVIRFTKADRTSTGGAAALTVDSSSFTVNPGSATQLAYTTQPGGGTAGIAWSQQPVVEVRDAAGNRVTSSSAAVTLSLTTGTGSLSGTATVNAVSGVATFAGLNIDAIGSNKVLSATSAGLTAATSSAFTIAAAATSVSSDVSASAGPNWANNSDVYTVTVTVVDGQGNAVEGRTVTLSSSRAGSDTITGTPATSDANGAAVFTVKSTTGGTSVVTAVVNPGSVTLTEQASLVFTDFAVSAAQSTWLQDRVSLAADGSTLLTVTGTLRNAAGTALPGKTLQLISSRGVSDVVSPASQDSDSSGNFSFTVKSALAGHSTLTLNVPSDAVNVTTKGRAQFLELNPISEWVSILAGVDSNKMFAGLNSPSLSTWADVANGGTADGSLSGFAFNNTTSGWRGDGGTTISNGATGAYRLGFDGSNDVVDAGAGLNSLASMSFEIWARPESVATPGRVLAGNADATKGLMLRSARDKSARWEGQIGGVGGTQRNLVDEILADSPAGYWRFSEASGSSTASAYGAVTQVAASTGITYNQAGALLSNDTSFAFNGSSGQIDLGNVYTPGTGSYSVEAWVRLSSAVTSVQRSVIAKQDDVSGIALEIDTNQQAVFTGFSGTLGVSATGASNLSTNTWYHVVGVRNTDVDCSGAAGAHVAVYVNGALDGCSDLTDAPDANTSSLVIGNNPWDNTRWFPGRIDEVAIYQSALSDSRVQAHYDARLVPVCYSGTLTDSNWFHVVFGFEDSSQNMRLQVNGTETCNLTAVGQSLNGSSAHMSLGAQSDGSGTLVPGTPWQGAIGEVRVYSQGVSSSEASANYSTQSSRYP